MLQNYKIEFGTGITLIPLVKRVQKHKLFLKENSAAKWLFEDLVSKRVDSNSVIIGIKSDEKNIPIAWVLCIFPSAGYWYRIYKVGKKMPVWRFTNEKHRNCGHYFSLQKEFIRHLKQEKHIGKEDIL